MNELCFVRRLIGLAMLLAVIAGGTGAGAHLGRRSELPNLVALPAFELKAKHLDNERKAVIRFAVAVANRGAYALDLMSSPGESEPTNRSTIAQQCVEWLTSSACQQRQAAGRFAWHQQHDHYHLWDFALYELRRFRSDMTPDLSRKGVVGVSRKASFCLFDSAPDRQRPAWDYGNPFYLCTQPVGFQGISPGWRDVYPGNLPGQSLSLRDLPDGEYALLVTVNPQRHLFESNYGDNRSVTGISIKRDGQRVRVFCRSRAGTIRCVE
jgi:hypothetical protein